MKPLSYREHLPPPDLSSWVACFWEIEGAPAAFNHRVLPDGCADLLFDLQAARERSGVAGEVIGPMSRALLVELRGAVHLLGVRLRPGAVRSFFGLPAHEILDRSVPAADLLPSLHISVAQLADSARAENRLGNLISACRARAQQVSSRDPLVEHAMRCLVAVDSCDSRNIAVLVRDLGLSERAFERRFKSQVGMTPVSFRRLARFRAVLRRFAQGHRDWAALSADAGFSDQSHLVREWQAFTGLTPTRWAATQEAGAGFLQDGRITAT